MYNPSIKMGAKKFALPGEIGVSLPSLITND